MIFYINSNIIVGRIQKTLRQGISGGKMITIQGEVEDIIFRNEINGYTVCSIKCDDRVATVIGHMVSLGVGETIKATGKWVNHPHYGEQFKAELCERQLPKTGDSIVKFLGSGIIKGVREATAGKIIERFGEGALDILESQPNRLSEIKGISLEKALAIGQAFREYGKRWDISAFLQQYGIGPVFINKIYKQFGDEAVRIIKDNPYRLADEIPGIGFKTADRIALSLGMDPLSDNRVGSCIIHVLIQAAVDYGHTYLPLEDILEYVSGMLGAEAGSVRDAAISLAVNQKVIIEKSRGTENAYLKSLNQAEEDVSRKLLHLSLVKFNHPFETLSGNISEIEEEQGIILADEQRKAVQECICNGAVVITGGPGTGKTTVVNTIVRLLERLGLTYVLAAPTGRAAKKLSEATGREARTIHRLLELGHMDDGEADKLFAARKPALISEDVAIIDETSMVDIVLMNHLLRSIGKDTRLIMVGDADQLPAVGPGNVLKDIISSEAVKVVRLTEIFRQTGQGLIVVNAHRINAGEYPELNNADGDFFILRKHTHSEILKGLITLCCERLPKNRGYDPLEDIQVLSPTRKGVIGARNLNSELQRVLNPERQGKRQRNIAEWVFREGDKVMQVKNNYDLMWKKNDGSDEVGAGVFNGDIGRITGIEQELVTVTYDDREVCYTDDALGELELAYAITVHKSQGSEFPVVVMPVFSGYPMLVTRNLLYTAITRAKEMVVLVGSDEDVKFMVDNFREVRRYSGLMERMSSTSAAFKVG